MASRDDVTRARARADTAERNLIRYRDALTATDRADNGLGVAFAALAVVAELRALALALEHITPYAGGNVGGI